MIRRSNIWKYTPLDGILALMAIIQFGCLLTWAFLYEMLPWYANLAIFIPMLLFFYFNPIVITHNFLHTPFFASVRLNNAFAMVNSINLGLPQILYKYHHLLHHQYSNDPKQAGTTLDPSSTFRFGTGSRQEHWIPYSAFSLFRDSTTYAFREIKKRDQIPQFIYQCISVTAGLSIFLMISWQWTLFLFLPLFYFGWFLAHLENYFEHHLATKPGSRYANAVSFYGKIYNTVMFNEGYHQEHHILPNRHWTQRPEIAESYGSKIKNAGGYKASHPPLLGFMEASN